METDFRSILADDATLVGLVSTRIYPSTYPQDVTEPCVRYQKITGAIGLHMQGSDGFSEDLMQVDVRALTKASADAVRAAIIAALHAYAGTEGTTRFQLIALSSDRGVRFESTGPKTYYTASLDFACYSTDAT